MRTVVTALIVMFTALGAPPWAPAGAQAAAPAAPATSTLNVSFKLDARLSGPTYGGERWVSGATYIGAAAQDAVEARVSAVDATGRSVKVSPSWTPSDPEMLAISPARGERVKITVRRIGESTVTVTFGGASRKLTVRAVERNGNKQVSITQ